MDDSHSRRTTHHIRRESVFIRGGFGGAEGSAAEYMVMQRQAGQGGKGDPGLVVQFVELGRVGLFLICH